MVSLTLPSLETVSAEMKPKPMGSKVDPIRKSEGIMRRLLVQASLALVAVMIFFRLFGLIPLILEPFEDAALWEAAGLLAVLFVAMVSLYLVNRGSTASIVGPLNRPSNFDMAVLAEFQPESQLTQGSQDVNFQKVGIEFALGFLRGLRTESPMGQQEKIKE